MPDLMQDRNINQPPSMAVPPAPPPPLREEEEVFTEVATGGSLAEAVCGIAVIVLAIVALAGVYPVILGAIAAIVAGAGLFLDGASVGARFSRVMCEIVGPRFSMSEMGGGMTAEFLSGAAGVVLGILALIGMVPVTLLAVAAIVFGGALLLGAGANASLNSLMVEHHYRTHEVARRMAGAMVSGATGAQVLVGLAAIVLGIIALTGNYALTLTLVAYLIAGAAVTLTGLALSTKMWQLIRR